ncbi:AfsA-related hotdog domain-containing protein [Pseudomonas chlororaphis]|uniref:AfsA-related hotdog domain-containing protein n=1 Tax=Pseudomonas chlororaphis TaxID=587753 RepID=UPI00046EFFF2|nr:AfsA-related hotdog domain-containing protein [Pseudomonas chlororaphis]
MSIMTEERKLDFERTLPISLVHKPSNDSVLLTDYVAQSHHETLLGAQVPRGHGLYQENVLDVTGYDIAALVEICRQACFAIAHNQFGLSLKENRYQFLFRELKSNITSAALDVVHPRGQPIRVVVASTVEKVLRSEKRTSGLTWRFELSDPMGIEIAVIRIRQNFVDRGQWKRIREAMCRQRGVVFQSAIEIPPESELLPSEVGRWNPQNLALIGVTCLGNHYEATARIDPRHPVLFDRPTADHIFAMIQLEASRQLAIYSAAKSLNVDPFKLKVNRCEAVFQSMGELNTPTTLHAEVSNNRDGRSGAHVDIQIIQGERSVSTFQIGVIEI